MSVSPPEENRAAEPPARVEQDRATAVAADVFQPEAPADLVAAVREFANTARWKTAVTDKSDPPHSYVLDYEGPISARRQGLKPGYDLMWHFIDDYGVVRRWRRWEYRSCDLVLSDGVAWSFWLMCDCWSIINRKPAEFAGWTPDRQ